MTNVATKSPLKPRRRWHQFSLRTFFVGMFAISAWMGWQAKIVSDRHQAIELLQEFNGGIVTAEGMANAPGVALPHIPFWRVWMGDQAVGQIIFPFGFFESREEETEQIKQLFPETVLTEVSWASPTAHLEE